MGLQVFVTELDVSDYGVQGSIASRDLACSKRYFAYLDFMLSVAKPKEVTFWSPTDSGNWMDRGGSHRQDNTPSRPGLTDNQGIPKSNYQAVVQTFVQHAKH